LLAKLKWHLVAVNDDGTRESYWTWTVSEDSAKHTLWEVSEAKF